MLQKLWHILEKRRNQSGPYAAKLWALKEYRVMTGLVYGGYQRTVQELAPEASDWDCPHSCWYPMVTSEYSEIQGPSEWKYVLCDPLLEQGCHKPWRTFSTRVIIVEWDEQAVPANIQSSTVVIEEIESDNEEDNHNKAATAAQGNNNDSDKRGDKEQQEVCEAETKANKNDDEEKDDEEKDIDSQRK